MQRRAWMLAALALLAGCDNKPAKRAPGERLNVIYTQPTLVPDEAAKVIPIEIPAQMGNDRWITRNDAMATGHVGLTGVTEEQSARIGDGNGFTRNAAPVPVVAEDMVIAMDAAGVISAHDANDIDTQRWQNEDAEIDDVEDVLGGGLTIAETMLYAATGYGDLLAIDLKSGKTKWHAKVGAPVRGAPAAGSGVVAVLSADNQTLAFDMKDGAPRWEHRGIRESAGYFATTAPVIRDDIVVAAYSSGEIIALRAQTGNVLWSDTVTSQIKTKASAVFSGIDADPLVQDGVVLAVSAGGTMQASALLNGRPLWQTRIGSHQTPWAAGNAVFVISDTHDVAGVLKRNGTIGWATSLAQQNEDGRDITPALYGPILAGNAVMVIDHTGVLHTFKPENGKMLGTYELADGVITPPVIANGALYLVTKNARLYRYN